MGSDGISANKKPLGPKAREVLASTWRRSPLRKKQSVEVRHHSHRTRPVCQTECSFVNDSAAVRETAAVLKLLRRGAVAGLLAGAAYAVWRFLASRAPDTGGCHLRGRARSPRPPRPVPNVARRPTPRSRPRADARAAAVGRAGRRRLPAVAPGQGEALERHLPRARRRQLRPHPRRALLRGRRRRHRRRPPRPQALTPPKTNCFRGDLPAPEDPALGFSGVVDRAHPGRGSTTPSVRPSRSRSRMWSSSRYSRPEHPSMHALLARRRSARSAARPGCAARGARRS